MKAESIVREARERLSDAMDDDRINREDAVDDLENLAGYGQWPDAVRESREREGRPCITINRLPQFVRQVTGDIRNTNPSVRVVPGDGKASDDVAEILEGMVRQIQYRSDASSVYEGAAESAAQCGMGFFRVRHDYEEGNTFDQEILIERISNPFSVHFDPAAKLPTREDADWCFVTQTISRDDFETLYPNKSLVEVERDSAIAGLENWVSNEDMVIAEYFWKEPEKRTIGLTEDGSIVEDAKPPLNFVKTREIDDHKVMWAKVSGKDVLEGPQEFPCRYIPVIAVMGEELQIGERRVRSSVIRYAKDPQRLYNYNRSTHAEVVSLQPKAPYLVTAKNVQGLEKFWNEANQANRPYLPYNPDEKAGPPHRAPPPAASSGLLNEAMTAADDMKATTGIYDAGLGNQSNEKSGVAIRQRQLESDISTSIYTDNMAKAVGLCGRIVVQMIPRIYDTKRLVRVIGPDGSEKLVEVNGVTLTLEGVQAVNDLRTGRYDVRVTTGPNYSTRRQESAESMIDFIRAFPAAAGVTADLVAQNMDWPGADEFTDRLKKILPPGIISVEDMDPEAQQQAMQLAQQQAQMEAQAQHVEMRKEMAETAEAEADAEKARLEVAEKSLELAINNGQINAAITQIVQEQVARALQGAMQQGIAPL